MILTEFARRSFRFIAVLVVLLTACADQQGRPHKEPTRRLDVSAGSSISGVALFEGEVPQPQTVDVGGDEYCVRHGMGETRDIQPVKVHDRRLQDVFVYVSEGLDSQYAPTSPNPVLDQKGCTYVPHVLGVVTGQPLTVLNSDSTLHNIHFAATKNDALNFGQSVAGMSRQIVFDKVETPIAVNCDVHHWMRAYVFVLPGPAFDVTGEDGKFSIPVPPGTYTVTAWHETLGTVTDTVTVKPGEDQLAEFTFHPPQ